MICLGLKMLGIAVSLWIVQESGNYFNIPLKSFFSKITFLSYLTHIHKFKRYFFSKNWFNILRLKEFQYTNNNQIQILYGEFN